MDPQSRHQVWDWLLALKKRGLTMVLTTHYMDEAEKLCDRLVILDHGRIITEGRPLELIDTHAGESVIEIEGVDELKPIAHHRVIPDRMEAGTFMTIAAITGGDLLLRGCMPEHLDAVTLKLRDAGVLIREMERGLRVTGPRRPLEGDIKTMPYPGFPTDMQAQFMALMTVCHGSSVIKETIFENRFMHVAELRRMGADITTEAGTATVRGVERLRGAEVMATDLRASACLVVAALNAKGRSVIHRIYHLDRGYDRIDQKLRRLGADVEGVTS